jgi:hypothetical protein
MVLSAIVQDGQATQALEVDHSVSVHHTVLPIQMLTHASQHRATSVSPCASSTVGIAAPRANVAKGNSKLPCTVSEKPAVQALLMEVARVRAYGFSERELKYTHNYLLADYESLYVERDQAYAQVGCGPFPSAFNSFHRRCSEGLGRKVRRAGQTLLPHLVFCMKLVMVISSRCPAPACAEVRTEDVYDTSVQEIRSEYVRHFLSEEFVVGRDAEARLFKSIIETITAEDVRQVAEQLRSTASCVVKAVSHRRCDHADALCCCACLLA